MLVSSSIFSVIDSRRVNLILGADAQGSGPLEIKVDVLPSTATADSAGNVTHDSQGDVPVQRGGNATFSVNPGGTLRIPVHTAFDFSSGAFAAVRATSQDGRPFVAYAALTDPRISVPVSGNSFAGVRYRLPLLDAPNNGAQNVKLVMTPLVTTTGITVKDLATGNTVFTANGVNPLHSIVFDQEFPTAAQLEVLGTDQLAVSALIARNATFRIYPVTLDV